MQKFGNLVLAVLINISLTLQTQCAYEVAPNELIIVVVTQNTPHHEILANKLRNDLFEQSTAKGVLKPIIHFTHEDIPHEGDWTFLPIIERLYELHATNSSWVFFCQDHTRINFNLLLKLLSQHDYTKNIWIGHGLIDPEPTIIHHFNDAPKFRYPLLQVGFAISTALLNSLVSRLESTGPPEADFSIDSSYELAQYVFDSGRGSALIHSSLLCLRAAPQCASYFEPFVPCGKLIANELIHFAVKTCNKFHESRIPVVQQTWAKDAKNLVFYSDERDSTIPTTDLGVANTVRGHCGKTMAIVRHASTLPDIQWLAIVDDDTLISVSRLQDFLTCYNVTTSLALGERYGYNIGNHLGYNYITGGGGIILNMAAVRLLATDCYCPSDSTPDDMYLGVCMRRLNINIVHSSRFHQARPPDYSPEILTIQMPISFHKHWMIDPVTEYQKWLAEPQDGLKHDEF